MSTSAQSQFRKQALANYLKKWFGVCFKNASPKDLGKVFYSHAECILYNCYYRNRDSKGRFATPTLEQLLKQYDIKLTKPKED